MQNDGAAAYHPIGQVYSPDTAGVAVEGQAPQAPVQQATQPGQAAYDISSLDTPETTLEPVNGNTPPTGAKQTPESTDPSNNKPKGVMKKALIGGSVILGVILLAVLITGLLARRGAQQESAASSTPDQSVSLDNTPINETLPTITGENNKLIVNGDIISQNSIFLASNNNYGQILSATLTTDQNYTLPNVSGSFCLDSNNCGYLVAADVTTTSINNAVGVVTLQGTLNQISVGTAGQTITLSTPQDIAVSSSPTFSSITLSNVGVQNGATICDSSNNCGFAPVGDAFVQNGNSFGAAAVLGTNDANSLSFETAGTTRATISASTGHLGIGSTTTPDDCSLLSLGTCSSVINVQNQFTTFASANNNGINNNILLSPTGAVATVSNGIYNVIGTESGNTQNITGAVRAIRNAVNHYGTGTIAVVDGMYSEVNNWGTGTISNVGGVQSIVTNWSTGSIGSLTGYHASVLNNTGTVTTSTGVKIEAGGAGAGSITTNYGIDLVTGANAGTLTTNYGIRVQSAYATGSTTTNYGILVQDQTAGSSDYGISIEGADTYALWLGSGADNTDAANGITFGLSGDTNLYRSAANTLKTDDSLDVGTQLQVGTGTGTFSQCAGPGGPGTANCTLDVGASSTETTTITSGINVTTTITPAGATNTQSNKGISNSFVLSGTQSFSGANYGIDNVAYGGTTAGTITKLAGSSNYAAQAGAGSTITDLIGAQAGVAQVAGTVTNGYGVYVLSTTGTVGANYGIQVKDQTVGTTDYGISIEGADTYALWVGSGADNTDAANGITFGLSGDTNLYRSAADTLQTDDALVLNGGVLKLNNNTGIQMKDTGGSYRTVFNFNAGNNLNINTGTATGNDIIFAPRNTTFLTLDQSANAAVLESSISIVFGGIGGDTNLLRSAANTLATNATTFSLTGASGTISTSTTNAALTVQSNGTGALTLDSGSTGAVNLGTGASAKTVTIGNSTGATDVNVNLGSGIFNVTNTAADANDVAQFNNAGATNCTVQPGGTGFACSSDARLKTNIVTLDTSNSLDVLNALNPVSFNWIDNPDGKTNYGFIAQELMQLIPSAVSLDSRGYYVANYDAVIPYTVKGIQLQQSQISSLNNTTTSNSSSIGDLNARISNLEQQLAALSGGSTNLNVSGSATIGTLSVTGSASIAGDLTVKGSVSIAGDLTVQGHIKGNADTRGELVVPAGSTEATYTFSRPYSSKPFVVASPTDKPVLYNVTITANGFTVKLTSPEASDTSFNFIAQQ